MEMAIIDHINSEDNCISILTESFLCEDRLYNASYIPADDFAATILLEKVIKYSDDKIYNNNKITLIVIHVINSTKIKLEHSSVEEKERYTIAMACAIAAYKFDLVKNYLTVEIDQHSIPIHISLIDR